MSMSCSSREASGLQYSRAPSPGSSDFLGSLGVPFPIPNEGLFPSFSTTPPSAFLCSAVPEYGEWESRYGQHLAVALRRVGD